MMKRILVTGPESSGKTTLAKTLQERLKADILPELARPYLTLTDGRYVASDIHYLYVQHKALLNAYSALDTEIIIEDTGPIVLQVWCMEKFSSRLLTDREIEEISYDLIVLCKPDIPWEADSLRENPDDRWQLYALFREICTATTCPTVEVAGDENARCKLVLDHWHGNNS